MKFIREKLKYNKILSSLEIIIKKIKEKKTDFSSTDFTSLLVFPKDLKRSFDWISDKDNIEEDYKTLLKYMQENLKSNRSYLDYVLYIYSLFKHYKNLNNIKEIYDILSKVEKDLHRENNNLKTGFIRVMMMYKNSISDMEPKNLPKTRRSSRLRSIKDDEKIEIKDTRQKERKSSVMKPTEILNVDIPDEEVHFRKSPKTRRSSGKTTKLVPQNPTINIPINMPINPEVPKNLEDPEDNWWDVPTRDESKNVKQKGLTSAQVLELNKTRKSNTNTNMSVKPRNPTKKNTRMSYRRISVEDEEDE